MFLKVVALTWFVVYLLISDLIQSPSLHAWIFEHFLHELTNARVRRDERNVNEGCELPYRKSLLTVVQSIRRHMI